MSKTSDDIKEFRKVLRNSDRPLQTSDAFYVPNLHGTQAEDVVQRLFDDIEETSATGLYYFTGQRGTGKSTELLRLQMMLNGADKRCILLESLNYLNDTQNITAEMLMLVVAAGVNDWIAATYPSVDFGKEPLFERFTNWLKTEVGLEKIEATTGPVKFTINLKPTQPSVQEKIENLNSRQRFHQQLIEFISQMCGWVQQRESRDVVVVVDSLERLRGSAFAVVGQDDIYRQVAEVFSDQLELLKVPSLKLVYSVPPYLGLLQNVRTQVSVYALASVRVYEHPSIGKRTPRAEGLNHMRALLSNRWPNWGLIFSSSAVDELALLSGGDLRQFVLRILIDALVQAEYAIERLPLAATDPIIGKIRAGCVSEMLQLTVRDEWPLLSSVAKDNNPIAQNKDQLKTLAHLLEVKVILNYRNGSDWFDLHPTLWSTIDAFDKSSDKVA